jgi:hypothetical protein
MVEEEEYSTEGFAKRFNLVVHHLTESSYFVK